MDDDMGPDNLSWDEIPDRPDNVFPLHSEPPAWMDEASEAWRRDQEAMTAVARVPLPLQFFEDIEEVLTGLWLMKHLLPAVGMAVIHGHPGSGKTFLALDWSLHIALGWDWQGRKVQQGLVVYLCAEGQRGLKNRVAAFRRHHKITECPFALIPIAIDMQAQDADVNRLIEAVRAAEAHYGQNAVMVVIDTLAKTFGGGKENTDDMVGYVANCQRVSAEFECLTTIVHHRPKDAESEDPRGHSSLRGGVETVVLVEAGETKKARVTKQKDGEDGIELLFKLKVVELGQDEDGEPVTSCIVEPTDVDLAPRGDSMGSKLAKLSDKQRVVLNALDETAERLGFYPPTDIPEREINRLKVGKVVKFEDWRERHAQTSGHGSDMKPDSVYKEFRRGLDRLKKDGIVTVYGPYAWRTWEDREPVRTTSDNRTDNNKFQPRTDRTNGVPPTGETPALSEPLSGSGPAASSDWKSNPLLNPDAASLEPPAWLDDRPPFDPDDWPDGPDWSTDA
ncbi:AAA family ATPase [Sphingomonas turrisvirgatae]|nr:AAA family ATPase [Sphingomonas turrisvirgatae]